MASSRLKIIAVVVIFTLLFSVSSPVGGFSQPSVIVPQKGMCYVTWEKDRFASEYSDASLTKLSTMGVKYVSICITQYQDAYNSTKIYPTDRTPSKKSIIHAIKKAHKLGLKVMLKPHIDLMDKHDGTYWRADIGFSNEKDWDAWFSSYEKFIMAYAKMAKKHKVEILCVGTELSFTTQKEGKWRSLIQKVKDVYKGEIIYAANWDNFKNIKFWDELSYVGIDAYFPLTYEASPSLEDLKNGWEKWKNEISQWHLTVNKPIVFTEIGYASTTHAPYEPWKGGSYGNADPDIQKKCYEAFFQTVWNEPWFAGVYWWKWDTNVRAGGKYNRQFTPQNKPAQEVIKAHYKGEAFSPNTRLAKEVLSRKAVEEESHRQARDNRFTRKVEEKKIDLIKQEGF